MSKGRETSAGVVLFRRTTKGIEVLLGHPGGPYFANRDDASWSIPKGRLEDGEAAEAAARREFREETGIAFDGPLIPLGTIEQRGGKIVHAWAAEWTNPIVPRFRSNVFSMEWPPKSGRHIEFEEFDDIRFFPLEQARIKINGRQQALLDRLIQLPQLAGTA